MEKPRDNREQEIARRQLQQIVHYAENAGCRRTELLRYFGEDFTAAGCGACDNCLSPPETFDGTISAQKFLSCVYRIRQKNGFGVGLSHVVEAPTSFKVSLPKAQRAGEIVCDETLFERLRHLRKKLADGRNVPAYIVFSDVSLRQMARDLPADEREFKRISGIGDKKLQEFGAIFLSEIAAYKKS